MADTKITGLTELAEAPNASDFFVVVDVSDTTMAASGTTKKVLKANALGGGGATNVWIPASSWIPRATNGAGISTDELATNDINLDFLDFDSATEEGAQYSLVMPSNWGAGTITAKVHWTAGSGSGGVVWGLSGRAYGDDDALDAAPGTQQTATDTLITALDEHISPATSAITLAGTPAAGKLVLLELTREVANGSDTLAVDVRLIGVEVTFS